MTQIIGLTGNIASGKSTVAQLMAAAGATVIDADVLARDAVAPGSAGLAAIAARWPSVMARDGTLDRAALRRVVFDDPAERAALDAIVHPEVARRRDALVAAARSRGDAIVVYDVPLLFEAGLDRDVDVIVFVDAPESVRRARLVAQRGLSPHDADAMIASQWPPEPKRARSHFVIDNAGDRAALSARVAEVWRALAHRAASG